MIFPIAEIAKALLRAGEYSQASLHSRLGELVATWENGSGPWHIKGNQNWVRVLATYISSVPVCITSQHTDPEVMKDKLCRIIRSISDKLAGSDVAKKWVDSQILVQVQQARPYDIARNPSEMRVLQHVKELHQVACMSRENLMRLAMIAPLPAESLIRANTQASDPSLVVPPFPVVARALAPAPAPSSSGPAMRGLRDLRDQYPVAHAKGPSEVLRVLLADPDRSWSLRGLALSEEMREAGRGDKNPSDKAVRKWLMALADVGLAKRHPQVLTWSAGPACRASS